MAPMLPPDFEWRPYVGGPALYLRERLVASAAELEPGFGYRVAINPDSIGRRYVFLATEDALRRYCEVWATKYQDRLRAGR